MKQYQEFTQESLCDVISRTMTTLRMDEATAEKWVKRWTQIPKDKDIFEFFGFTRPS